MKPSRLAVICSFSALAAAALGCCGPLACGPVGCRGGCGECYIDPWINDPAPCCDPCNHCGEFTGQRCTTCRPFFSGVPSLWGYRYDAGCCDSCGHGGAVGMGVGHGGCADGCCDGASGSISVPPHGSRRIGPEEVPPGETILEDADAESQSYMPSRNRQIFRPRGPVVSRPTNQRF